MPITNCINLNHQGVRAATGSSSAIPPISSTTSFDEPSEVASWLYILFVKYHLLHLFCSNNWVHRQTYQMSKLHNQQVSMPPSPSLPMPKQNAKLQQILKHSQNDKGLCRSLHLPQCHWSSYLKSPPPMKSQRISHRQAQPIPHTTYSRLLPPVKHRKLPWNR